jgi:hypothetical protein
VTRSPLADLKLLYAAFAAGDLLLIAAKAAIDFAPESVPHLLEIQLDLGREGVFAAWWSSLQLLAAGILALAHLYARGGGAGPAGGGRWGWPVLAAFFVWLSMDETSQVHERIGDSLAERLGPEGTILGLKGVYLWLAAFAPAAAAAGVWAAVFCYRRLGARAARIAALCGAALFAAVLAIEYAEGAAFAGSGEKVVRVARGWAAVAEEGCELAGAACFVVALGESLRARTR